jgi:hypothetical protein
VAPPVELPANPFASSAPASQTGAAAGTGTNSAKSKTVARKPQAKTHYTRPSGALIVFDNSRQQVELVVPGPERWTLFVNEPDVAGQPTVGTATGTSGTLVVPYPKNFCGVIQGDILVGVHEHGPGKRSTIATCQSPVVRVSPQQGGGEPSPPPATVTPTATNGGGGSGGASNGGSDQPTLPFTGVGRGIQGSAIAGSCALVLGLALLFLSSPRHPRLVLARRRVTRTLFWLLGDY